MNTRVSTPEAPAPRGPYSQAIVADGLVFTAGQIGLTVDGSLRNESIEQETRQVMDNLQAVLQAAGSNMSRVVKATVFTTDISLFAAVNSVYSEYFKEGTLPAREFVGINSLPLGARVEISMIATQNKGV